MWVFTVLILTSSYTANLTSVLTIQQLNPTMNEWTDSDYVGVQADPFIEGMVREMGFDESGEVGRRRREKEIGEDRQRPRVRSYMVNGLDGL